MTFFIAGAGGHARLVLDAWRAGGNPDPDGFLDDDVAKHGTMVDGLPVAGTVTDVEGRYAGSRIILGIGAVDAPTSRVRFVERLVRAGCTFATVVHPSAVVARGVAIPPGAVLLAGAIVNRGASIAEHVTVYTGSIVEHDTTVGAHTQIAPAVAIAGGVSIGARAFIGIGATIIHGIRIGDDVVVGAGSVVTRDVPPGARVAGIPARAIGKAVPH